MIQLSWLDMPKDGVLAVVPATPPDVPAVDAEERPHISLDEMPVDLGPPYPEHCKAIQDSALAVYNDTHDWGSYTRCLEIWAAVLDRFTPDGEERYMQKINGLKASTLVKLSDGFGALLLHFCYEGRFSDILGPVYMDLGSTWGRKHMGQFFTPWNIALMMADMNVGDFGPDEVARLTDGPPLTVCDPAIGSAVMMLAAKAIIARDHGRKALRMVKCYGQDIDETCCIMARIQMTLTDDWFMTNWMIASSYEVSEKMKATRGISP